MSFLRDEKYRFVRKYWVWWKTKWLVKLNWFSLFLLPELQMSYAISNLKKKTTVFSWSLSTVTYRYVSRDISQTETWKLGSRMRRNSHCSSWHGHVMSQLWSCDLSWLILHREIDLDLQSAVELEINVYMVIALLKRSQFEMFSNLNVVCRGAVNGQFLVATTACSMNILWTGSKFPRSSQELWLLSVKEGILPECRSTKEMSDLIQCAWELPNSFAFGQNQILMWKLWSLSHLLVQRTF